MRLAGAVFRVPLAGFDDPDGERVALVSDAGLPGISDPGGRLVRAALDVRRVLRAPPGAFHPSPEVTSAVVELVPVRPPRARETERFRAFSYNELVTRDKASLDIFWLRDESLEDSENLPAPEVIAAEIVEDLQAALDQFAAIAASLGTPGDPS